MIISSKKMPSVQSANFHAEQAEKSLQMKSLIYKQYTINLSCFIAFIATLHTKNIFIRCSMHTINPLKSLFGGQLCVI